MFRKNLVNNYFNSTEHVGNQNGFFFADPQQGKGENTYAQNIEIKHGKDAERFENEKKNKMIQQSKSAGEN